LYEIISRQPTFGTPVRESLAKALDLTIRPMDEDKRREIMMGAANVDVSSWKQKSAVPVGRARIDASA
jgi:hypothetical protein